MVKQLEWSDKIEDLYNPECHWHDTNNIFPGMICNGVELGGVYRIEYNHVGYYRAIFSMFFEDIFDYNIKICDTFEQAKQACQEHFQSIYNSMSA